MFHCPAALHRVAEDDRANSLLDILVNQIFQQRHPIHGAANVSLVTTTAAVVQVERDEIVLCIRVVFCNRRKAKKS